MPNTIDLGKFAAHIHAAMCNDPRFGYSQEERWGGGNEYLTGIYEGFKWSVRCGDYDCSSSFITAWKAALRAVYGTSPMAYIVDDATYTGDIEEVFVGSGYFDCRPMSFLAGPGDGYLKPGSHVAMCQTQMPDVLSEFSINEYGQTTGGRRGDQTGREAYVHGYYNFANRIIHWTGRGNYNPPAPEPPHGYSAKLYHTNGTPMQRFRIRQASGGWVRLESVGRPGMFLDLRDGAKASGTPVRVWEGPTDAQLLKLIPVQKPYAMQYEIEFKHAPGMRLDAKHGGTVDRTGLWIYKDNDTPAQRWQFIDCGDGTYIIVSSKSGLAIDCGAGVQP